MAFFCVAVCPLLWGSNEKMDMKMFWKLQTLHKNIIIFRGNSVVCWSKDTLIQRDLISSSVSFIHYLWYLEVQLIFESQFPYFLSGDNNIAFYKPYLQECFQNQMK